jgi:sarcosine oxidase subunit beta
MSGAGSTICWTGHPLGRSPAEMGTCQSKYPDRPCLSIDAALHIVGSMSKTADVVVIGGGINGAAIAFNLAKRGTRVALLEKRSIASGPTGRSVGIIRQHYSSAVTARMALRGLQEFENFDDMVGGECDFHQTGFLLSAREEELETLEANVALQQSVGINTSIISVDEIRELEPDLNTDGLVAAAYEPESGYADPHSTTSAYVNRAEELGAEIFTGTCVREILVEEGRVAGVRTDEGRIAAATVVLAAGPWSPLLSGHLGIELPIDSITSEVCYYRWAPEMECRTILIDTSLGLFAKPETGRLMMAGSVETKEPPTPPIDPDNYGDGVDFDTVDKYAQLVMRRFPAMNHGEATGGYTSLYDITPDWNPILGPLPGIEGLFCAAGSSGHGFKLAPAVGEILANLVLGGDTDGEDLEIFRLSRFVGDSSASGAYRQKILG